MGRPGIKDLKVFNKALLGKCLWMFYLETQTLWRGLMKDKYGLLEGGWRTRDIALPSWCGLWRNILKGWDVFLRNISFKVGDWARLIFGEINDAGMTLKKMRSRVCIKFLSRER